MSSKDFSSVDSTIIPTSSVQSIGGSDSSSLALAMERFSITHSSRIRRSILNLIRGSLDEGRGKVYSPKQVVTRKKAHSLLAVSDGAKGRRGNGIPAASLLRPPRGNISCAMKDLNKEFLALRRLPLAERSAAAARFIRTLDPALRSHSELALSLFLIATV